MYIIYYVHRILYIMCYIEIFPIIFTILFQTIIEGKPPLMRQSTRQSLLGSSDTAKQPPPLTRQSSIQSMSLNHTDTIIQPIKLTNGPSTSKADDQNADIRNTTHVQKLTTLMRQHSTIDTIMATQKESGI